MYIVYTYYSYFELWIFCVSVHALLLLFFIFLFVSSFVSLFRIWYFRRVFELFFVSCSAALSLFEFYYRIVMYTPIKDTLYVLFDLTQTEAFEIFAYILLCWLCLVARESPSFVFLPLKLCCWLPFALTLSIQQHHTIHDHNMYCTQHIQPNPFAEDTPHRSS